MSEQLKLPTKAEREEMEALGRAILAKPRPDAVGECLELTRLAFKHLPALLAGAAELETANEQLAQMREAINGLMVAFNGTRGEEFQEQCQQEDSAIDFANEVLTTTPGLASLHSLNADLDRRLADARTINESLASRNAELEEIVSRLPKTRDGNPITLGMNLWAKRITNDDPRQYAIVRCGFILMKEDGGELRDTDGEEWEADYDHCYSTEAAARAAMEGEK